MPGPTPETYRSEILGATKAQVRRSEGELLKPERTGGGGRFDYDDDGEEGGNMEQQHSV